MLVDKRKIANDLKIIVVFIAVFALCSNGYIFLSGVVPVIAEVYWLIVLLGFAIFFFWLEPGLTLSNIPPAAFIWIIVFILSTMLAIQLSTLSETVVYITKTLVKALTAFVFLLIIMTNEKTIKAALYSLLAVVVVGSMLNLYEFFNPAIQWSIIPGRSAGWYLNANQSGITLVMSLVFASLIVPKKSLWLLIMITTCGVLVTFSRTAWILLLIAIIGISIQRYISTSKEFKLLNLKIRDLAAIVVAVAIAGSFIPLIFSGHAYKLVENTPFESLLTKKTAGRISGTVTDAQKEARKDILIEAIQAGARKPILGNGLAYTYEWRETSAPHNDYALFFAERGIIGLLVILAFIRMIWVSGSSAARLYAVIFALSALATHTSMQQAATYVFAVLALLINNKDYVEESKTKDKKEAEKDAIFPEKNEETASEKEKIVIIDTTKQL